MFTQSAWNIRALLIGSLFFKGMCFWHHYNLLLTAFSWITLSSLAIFRGTLSQWHCAPLYPAMIGEGGVIAFARKGPRHIFFYNISMNLINLNFPGYWSWTNWLPLPLESTNEFSLPQPPIEWKIDLHSIPCV